MILIISDGAQYIGIRKSHLILDNLVLSEPLVAPPDAGDQSRPTGGLRLGRFLRDIPGLGNEHDLVCPPPPSVEYEALDSDPKIKDLHFSSKRCLFLSIKRAHFSG